MTKANVGGQMASAAAALRAAETYIVRRLEDQDTIRRLLEGRPAYSAYALGQLEPDRFPLSQWWLAEGEGSWALQTSVYLHLNPVRVKGLGLGKIERKAASSPVSLRSSGRSKSCRNFL